MHLNIAPIAQNFSSLPALTIAPPLDEGSSIAKGAATPSDSYDLEKLYEQFSNLPLELRIAVLLQLPFQDLHSFSLANKFCHHHFYEVMSALFNASASAEDSRADMDARTTHFLSSAEFKSAFRRGAYTPNEWFFVTSDFEQHRPFRALIESLPCGQIKKSTLLDAARLVLSTTNDSQDIALQNFVEIGLLSKEDYQNLLTTFGKSEIVLSKSQWSFFRRNMLGLLLLAQKQELNIPRILEIPDDRLGKGMRDAFAAGSDSTQQEQRAEIMFENKIFLNLHKNILFSSHDDPVTFVVSKLIESLRLEEGEQELTKWTHWLERFIRAGATFYYEQNKDPAPDCTPPIGYVLYNIAIENNYINILKLLIDAGVNPNWINASDETLLDKAVQLGSLDIVKALLEKGANPNQLHRDGHSTTLLMAIEQGLDPVLINALASPLA